MAEAEKRFKTVEVTKTEQVEDGVTLHLSKEEATALAALTDRVQAGAITGEIYNALYDQGFRGHDYRVANTANGSSYLHLTITRVE